MSGHVHEEILALYSSGDLSANQMESIAGHVQLCPACRKSVEEFSEVRAFVADSLQEPSIGDLQAVRAGSAMTWRQPRRVDRRWAWVLTAAAAWAIFAIHGGKLEQPPTTERPSQRLATQSAATPQRSVAPSVAVVRRPAPSAHVPRRNVRAAGIREVSFIASADQPSLIKMTTDDPNVVIVWQPRVSKEEER